MQIKVNGLCRADDIRGAERSGVGYVGLQFAKGKPHRMVMRQRRTGTLPDTADSDYSSLIAGWRKSAPRLVGMFSDEGAQDIVTAVYGYRLDCVQFDSDCGATFVRNLTATIVPDVSRHLGIIKAFDISHQADFASCREYEDVAELFILRFHSPSEERLSCAEMAEMTDSYRGKTPFLVGCTLGEAVAVSTAFAAHPRFGGLDLSVGDDSLTVEQYQQKLTEIRQICG